MDILKRASKDEVIPEFSGIFETVLKPVKHRVPVDFLRDWQTSIKTRESIGGDVSKLHQAAITYLSGDDFNALADDDKLWAEAVIYVTLNNLIGYHEVVWIDGLPGVSLETNIIPAELVLDKLTSLYGVWKDSHGIAPCARPYAYCMLIEAALNIKSFRLPLGSSDLLNYLKTDKGDKHPYFAIQDYYNWGNKGRGKNTNILTTFIKSYGENDSPIGFVDDKSYELDHFKKIDLGKVKINEKRSKEGPLKILVAGLTGSGKTCLIKELYFGTLKSYYLPSPFINLSVVSVPTSLGSEIESYTKADKPKPNVEDCFELESTFKVGNDSSFKMSLIDTRGGLLKDPPRAGINWAEIKEVPTFERNLADTDLLLLVIDPETFFQKDTTEYYSQVVGGLTSRLPTLFNKSQHAMIGIVFSKFDEYGIAISGNRRLIQQPDQINAILNFQQERGQTHAWVKLLDSITQNFSDESMKQTLVVLMEKIRGLLDNIIVGHQHSVFNIYLTSVQFSNDEKTFRRSGIPMIFDDFTRYMDWLINVPLPDKIVNAKYIRGKGVELSWNNPYWESGTFVIMRSSNGGKFERIGDISQAGAPGNYAYFDPRVESGKQYTYKLTRNDGTDGVVTKVLTPPTPVRRILPKLAAAVEGNNVPTIELEWEESASDYEVNYTIIRKEYRKQNNEEKMVKESLLMTDFRGNNYNDHNNLRRNSKYSYEIVTSPVDDGKIMSDPIDSGKIIIPPPKIDWFFIIIMLVLVGVLIYLVQPWKWFE